MNTIAIVGATGLAGEKLVYLLSTLPDSRVKLFGNSAVNTKIRVGKIHTSVESCDKLLSDPPKYAMFMAPEEVAAYYVPKLLKKGVTVIDNSSRFRLRKDVPLIVPCINGQEARGHNLIANPNCSTIQVTICLNALKPLDPTKLTVVTYQAASGAGREGLNDLLEQRSYGRLQSFRHPLNDNIIPSIGELRPDGVTSEERKLTDESRKILRLPRLKVNAFCARVPVTVGHGAFVNVQFKERFDLNTARTLLKNAPNVLLLDDAECGLYPMPLTVRNTKYVGVGRITKDPTANGLNFFCAADNLLRGAAYNAYEILLDKIKENDACL